MPAAQAFPLEKLMNALHVYQKNSQQKIIIEYVVLDKVNDEEPHAYQLGKLLETSQVVTIDVASPEAGVIKELVAKGETVETGFKIAIISKSGEGAAHVAPLEKIPERAASKPSLAEKIEEVKPKPKVETAPVLDKQPKAPSSALQLSPSFHVRTGKVGAWHLVRSVSALGRMYIPVERKKETTKAQAQDRTSVTHTKIKVGPQRQETGMWQEQSTRDSYGENKSWK